MIFINRDASAKVQRSTLLLVPGLKCVCCSQMNRAAFYGMVSQLCQRLMCCRYLTVGFNVDAPHTIRCQTGAAISKVPVKGHLLVCTREAGAPENKQQNVCTTHPN